MSRSLSRAGLAALLLLGLPTSAFAHTGHAGAGFLSGLLHPVFGVDHFLAMLSVGIVSAQLGGRKIFIIPGLFIVSMIAGAAAGVQGHEWSLVELGIAISVVVLGFAIATVKENGSAWLVMAAVAFFGSLHGNAHGIEMPRSADPIYYAAGFLASTTAIHLLGVGIGHLLTARATFTILLRHMGSLMAGMGLMILLNVIAPK